MNAINKKRKKYLSGLDIKRFVKQGNSYLWIMGGPTWPSDTYDTM